MELQVQNAGLKKRLERLSIENETLEKRQREKDEVLTSSFSPCKDLKICTISKSNQQNLPHPTSRMRQILLVGFADCAKDAKKG